MAEKEKKEEAIAVKQNQQMAVFDMEEEAGKGLEGADKDSYAIPFLTVLQATSPAVEKLDGAKMGMIMETVNQTLFKEVNLIPVAFSRTIIIWQPRDEGGKFQGQITMDQMVDMEERGLLKRVENDKGITQVVDEKGLIYTDTRQHYVLFEQNGSWLPAMIAMSRTQVKRSKKWVTQIGNFELPRKSGQGTYNPPSYARVYKATTEKEENEKGKWFSWLITPGELVQKQDILLKAKGLHTRIASGKVRVDHDQAGDQSEVVEGKVHRKGF